MIAVESVLPRIRDISIEYGVERVVLFGSTLRSPETARDIDLGVRGVAPSKFFEYYGELLAACPCSVDLVDLADDTQFTRLIEREGKVVYERL